MIGAIRTVNNGFCLAFSSLAATTTTTTMFRVRELSIKLALGSPATLLVSIGK